MSTSACAAGDARWWALNATGKAAALARFYTRVGDIGTGRVLLAWAPVRHFQHVEIDGETMRMTPLPFVLPKP